MTSALLGVVRGKNQIRTLLRDRDFNVVVPLDHWQWAVTESLSTMNREGDLDSECLREILPFAAPTTVEHRRNFKVGGAPKQEVFEAVRAGAVLTVNVLASTAVPKERQKQSSTRLMPPDEKDVADILHCIGKFYGISQWGNKYQYGRFSLLELERATPAEIASILGLPSTAVKTDTKKE